MDIAVIGGGINGLSCAWELARRGHEVSLYERDALMGATSRASSKLLHGGLRYLEHGQFRLVREALRERDAWLRRVPELAWPIRLTLPVYRTSRRPRWMVALGLRAYDHLAGRSALPGARWLSAGALMARDSGLNPSGLLGGYEFSDGQMDDYRLGCWVAQQARAAGVRIFEHSPVSRVARDGSLMVGTEIRRYDHLLNVAGPWAVKLLETSGLQSPFRLDLVRGSHLLLGHTSTHGYLLEVPGERRIFFVLPWNGRTLVGTTEVRQELDRPIACDDEEQAYLTAAFRFYFPDVEVTPAESFAGLRPLLYSSEDPTRASREYAIHREGCLTSVFGGKWTTTLALAGKVSRMLA
jgi:glycerol-3-phosphate dehydrogenase